MDHVFLCVDPICRTAESAGAALTDFCARAVLLRLALLRRMPPTPILRTVQSRVSTAWLSQEELQHLQLNRDELQSTFEPRASVAFSRD